MKVIFFSTLWVAAIYTVAVLFMTGCDVNSYDPGSMFVKVECK